MNPDVDLVVLRNVDSSSRVQVTPAPEPTMIVGTLVAGGLGIGLRRKKTAAKA